MGFYKKIFFFCLCLSASMNCRSQDIHFSQYYQTPLAINPALTGEGEGDARFILNYRSQWNSITGNPYKTFGLSADRSFLKDGFAAGCYIFNDKAGNSDFGVTQVSLSLASRVQVNKKDFLKAGISGAWTQRHLSTRNLTWNSQFDGKTIDPYLNSGESSFDKSINYIDFAIGMIWIHQFSKKTGNRMNFGFSAFHVIRPAYEILSATDKERIRWNVHADSWISVNPGKFYLNPSVLAMAQGSETELDLGLMAKIIREQKTGMQNSGVWFGVFYRNKDAIILTTGYEHQGFIRLNISYDINISRLMIASSTRGGLELSLQYIRTDKKLRKK